MIPKTVMQMTPEEIGALTPTQLREWATALNDRYSAFYGRRCLIALLLALADMKAKHASR